MRTHHIKVLLPALGATLLVAACSSTPPVRVDYDKQADFGKYRTFGFLDQSEQPGAPAKSLATQTLEAAATREMQARGYTLSDKPDLVLNFYGKLEDRADVESVPGPYYGPGWGYGGWYGGPYGGWSSSQVTTRHYKVGTLIMDIVDRERKQAVFQAVIEKTVTEKMQENREASLNKAVNQMFSEYPFVAGQSAPVTLPDKK